MALQVWLPLTGTLANQGLANVSVTNNGATVSDNGKIGKCYSFNGSSSYLRFPYAINSFRSHMSISFWVNLNNLSSNQCIMSSRTAVSDGFAIFYLSSDNAFRFDNGSNSVGSQWSTNVSISASTWTHITLVQNGSTRQAYVNGALASSATYEVSGDNTAQYILIGASSPSDSTPNGNYLNGRLNDVRLYDHALSAKEIHELAKGLVLHYPLNNNGLDNQLPSTYQRVEYLESTGTQYIDTFIYPTEKHSVELELSVSAITNGKYIYGSYQSNKSFFTYIADANGLIQSGWGSQYKNSTTNLDTARHQWKQYNDGTNAILELDGTVISTQVSGAATAGTTFKLFRGENQDSGQKVYSFKMGYGAGTIMELVPCYRKSDGKPGMYDMVSGSFKTNAGTGEFLLGPSVGLPMEYQQVEYLESTGTQWIDTTETPAGTSLQGVISFSQIFNHNFMFGTWDQLSYGAYGSNSIEACVGGTTKQPLITNSAYTQLNRPYNIYLKAGTGIIVDGTTLASITTTSTSTAHLLLFSNSYNNGTTSYAASWQAKGRMYGCRLFKTSATRDFIPCYRKSDGKPGMYDVINNVFYVNSGSGEFLLGPSVGLPSRYRQVEYIENPSSTAQIDLDTLFNAQSAYVDIIHKTTTRRASMIIATGSANRYWWIYDYSNNGLNVYANTNNGQKNVSAGITDTNLHHSIWQNNHYYVDGVDKGSITDVCGSGDTNLTLFAYHPGDTTYNYYGRIYSAKIHDYSRVVNFDLVPCYDMVSQKYGMYDLCNAKFFTNRSGSAAFTAGPFIGHEKVVTWPNEPYEFDTSGYGYNGTRVGAMEYVEDSPRYKCMTKFPTGANYIVSDLGSFNWYQYDKGTISIWFKPFDTPSAWTGSYGIECDQSSNYKSFAISNYAGKFTVQTANGNWVLNSTGGVLANNQWYHLAAVLEGTTIKMYLNGALVDTKTISWGSTTTHTRTQATVNNDLGGSPEYGNNAVSDFRFYVTALSADDILELYHTGCSIDSSGNWHINEVYEQ